MAVVVVVGVGIGGLGAVGGFVPKHVGLVALQHEGVDIGVASGVWDTIGGVGDFEGVGVGRRAVE